MNVISIAYTPTANASPEFFLSEKPLHFSIFFLQTHSYLFVSILVFKFQKSNGLVHIYLIINK